MQTIKKPASSNAGKTKKVHYGKDTNYFFLIPQKALPVIENLCPDIPGYTKERMFEVISTICHHLYKPGHDLEGYTPIKLQYLRNIVPHAELYLKLLINLGIVERRNNARPNQSSNLYRISDQYYSKNQGLPLTEMALLQRIRKQQSKMVKYNSRRYLNQNKLIRQTTVLPEVFDHISTIQDIRKYNYAISAVYRIMNKKFYYTVDDTSHRYHSNITILPKKIRKYIRINDKPLVNIDTKNCQPYLLACIFNNPAIAIPFAKGKNLASLLKYFKVNKTEDVIRFIDLTSKGTIYEFLEKEFTIRGLKGYDRDKVKKTFLTILFDRNYNTSKVKSIFIELFPEVHKLLCVLRGNLSGDKFTKYSRLAILLQSIESHIILERVLNRIYTENPNIIAITIHDSIMTSIYFNHIQTVKTIMEEEFTSFCGIKPIISVEETKENDNE